MTGDALGEPQSQRERSGPSPRIARFTVEDGRYPPRLRHLHDPPRTLFCRGHLSALEQPSVAIVGSRRSTAYGRRVAEELAREAARAGWCVVSGMALGIDAAAHRGCMAGGGVTLAVLGSGVDRAYPRSHASLMTRILQRGLVLSEHEPGVSPRPHHFPRRNRILAALADRVVVVEAAKRSGALITAAVAADLGRDVWAVPGSIFSSNTGGTHRLLEDGAIPVSSLEAWRISLAEGAEGLDSPGDVPPSSQLALRPHLAGLPRQVWEALEAEPLSLEGLADALGTPGREILPVLASLELEGWLERRPGPTYLRAVA